MRWRFGTVALVAIAATGALIFTLTTGTGSQSQIQLDGVPMGNLADFGVSVLPPDGDPSFDARAAEDAAKANVSPSEVEAEVKETLLVHVVKEGAIPPIDELAWAVNFEPATVSAAPPYGFGLRERPEDAAVLCAHPLYFVSFIDAQTGAFILATEQSTAASADDCP
jgi:hypothetical protein